MTGEDPCAAVRIEGALRADPRTRGLGVRVEADGSGVVLRGAVASRAERLLLTQVAAEHAGGLTMRNEVSVTGTRRPPDMPGVPPVPGGTPDVLPLPEETAPLREVPPPRQASS